MLKAGPFSCTGVLGNSALSSESFIGLDQLQCLNPWRTRTIPSYGASESLTASRFTPSLLPSRKSTITYNTQCRNVRETHMQSLHSFQCPLPLSSRGMVILLSARDGVIMTRCNKIRSRDVHSATLILRNGNDVKRSR